MARDLYETLGVPRTADEDTIRKAFRKLAAKYHPDKNPGKDAEAKFKEINQAHEILSSKDKRSLYDEFGEDSLRSGFDAERARAYRQYTRGGGGGRGGSVSFQDLFGGSGGGGAGPDLGDLFGDMFGRQRGPRKGADTEAEVSVDFVSSLRGTTVQMLRAGQAEPLSVRIPAGVVDGGRVRIAGHGAPAPGGLPGDLVLTVRVGPHPFFKREGDDLHLELPLTLVEAYEGARVRVPTIDGEVTLKVPPRTQSGQVTRLRGKGVARRGKPAGDLYVRYFVRIPDSTDPEVQKAIEALRPFQGEPRQGLHL
jgi:curved DNA-binding protein